MKKFLIVVFGLIVFGLIGVIAFDHFYIAPRIPSIEPVKHCLEEAGQHGTVFDRDGRVIARLTKTTTIAGGKTKVEATRTILPYDKIPQVMIDAAVFVEDRSFWTSDGVNYFSILRCIAQRVKAKIEGKRFECGASTIAMQVAKLYNRGTVTKGGFLDKIIEARMAHRIIEEVPRKDVLACYLNRADYGKGAGGLNVSGLFEAARVYFAIQPNDLDLGKSVTIAKLFRKPSMVSEADGQDQLKKGRDRSLRVMLEKNFRKKEEVEAALASPLGLADKPGDIETDKTGFLSTHVRNQMVAIFGKDATTTRGAEVETTFDCELQTIAEPVVRTELASAESRLGIAENKKRLEVGMAILDPHTGEILAMIGGRSEQAAGLLNRALRRRQVGSTMKPMVYAIAYEHLDLWDSYPPTCLDRKRSYRIFGKKDTDTDKDWEPKNYGDKYRDDEISLAQGLIDSSNACTANLAWRLGGILHQEELEATWTSTMTIHLEPVIEMAERFGYPNTIQLFEPSKIIGAGEASPVEMATIYGVFPNGGWRHEPHWIKKITVQGVDMTPPLPESRRVLSSTVAYFMVDNLRRVAAPIQKDIPAEVGGKTGTTNSSRVTWFCGFTPTLGGCVFVAHDDNSPMPKKAIGGNTARPIWVAVMKEALKLPRYAEPKSFTVPPGIEFQEVNGMKLAVPVGKTVSATVASSTVSGDNEGH